METFPYPVMIDEVVRGKYRIERLVGQGGMGFVVAAHHIALDQRVAIKFLLPQLTSNQEVVDRFAREARAASKIESEHVSRVMDVDALDDGTPFIVMEFLEGSDLSRVRKEGRPLPAKLAIDYMIQACEAIGEAHRLGIVHRDIKPANIFVAKRGDGRTRVKVLDFGISKMDGPGSVNEPSVTKTSMALGSAEYMSPEQMRSSRSVDLRSDIWALGATLYELLTARVPFAGETVTQVCMAVMETEPPLPSSLRADLPDGLDAVVMRCLVRDVKGRYQTVAELIAALSRLAPLASAESAVVAPGPAPAGRGAQSSGSARGFSSPSNTVAMPSSPSQPAYRSGAASPSPPNPSSPGASSSPSHPAYASAPSQPSTPGIPAFAALPLASGSGSSPAVVAAVPPPAVAPTGAGPAPLAPTAPRRSPVMIVAGVAVAVVVGAVAAFAARGRSTSAASAAPEPLASAIATAAAAVTVVAAPAPVEVASAAPTASAAPVPEASATAEPSATAESAAPDASTPARVARPAQANARPSGPAKPAGPSKPRAAPARNLGF